MATDSGIIARIEGWFVSQLKGLTVNGAVVFKTADHWRWQLQAGGRDQFEALAPFALVSYDPQPPQREGDYDLCINLGIAVAIGVAGGEAGEARIGCTARPGYSKLHDLVINLFEDAHPGAGFGVDNFHFAGELVLQEAERRFAGQLQFEAKYLVIPD